MHDIYFITNAENCEDCSSEVLNDWNIDSTSFKVKMVESMFDLFNVMVSKYIIYNQYIITYGNLELSPGSLGKGNLNFACSLIVFIPCNFTEVYYVKQEIHQT